MQRLLLDRPTLDSIKANKPLKDIRAAWQKDLDDFAKTRAKYLMY